MTKEGFVELKGSIVTQTNDAVLWHPSGSEFDGVDMHCWIPRSLINAIHYETPVRIEVAEWFAEQRGLE